MRPQVQLLLEPGERLAKLDEAVPDDWPTHWVQPYADLPIGSVLRIRWVNEARMRIDDQMVEVCVVGYSTSPDWTDLWLLPRAFMTGEHFDVVR